jgi:hypothetical protein
MIQRLREGYVGAVAADRGALAFVKWFVIGLFLQVLFLIPLLPLMLATLTLREDLQPLVGSLVFFACFLTTRVFLFALPCAEVGARKRRGQRWLWLTSGVVFGMFALGVAAALEPKGAKA